MAPKPRAWTAVSLVASLWDQVHVVIGDVQHIESARVRGVAVIDLVAIFDEHTDTRRLRHCRHDVGCHPVVVFRFALRHLLGRERYLVVKVEITSSGGIPGKTPAHPLSVRRNRRMLSTRNSH